MEAASSVIKNISRTTCEAGTGRHLGGRTSIIFCVISKEACSFKLYDFVIEFIRIPM